MPSDAQKRATERYQKEKVKQQTVKFYPTDMDLWEHLQKQSNKMGYVKALIRADMERGDNEMNAETKDLIETGRAMVWGDYTIEAVTSAYGEPSRRDEVYVFDRHGNTVHELHEKGELLLPVTFAEARAWCEANA